MIETSQVKVDSCCDAHGMISSLTKEGTKQDDISLRKKKRIKIKSQCEKQLVMVQVGIKWK